MRFCRYQLRTSDVAAARALYGAILGEGRAEIVPLPAEAAARGAPSHWLGHLGADDVEDTVRRFVEHGATRVGPTRATPAGGAIAIVRDPGQAVVAVATPPATPSPAGVAWHQLYAGDVARAVVAYEQVFGWRLHAGDGSIVETTVRPGIHPQWLFYFRVAALAPALSTIAEAGGTVMGPEVLPNGRRIAVCEDGQRAAFALLEDALS